MANIKQQKKRILQAEAARVRNKSVRSEVKTRIRRVREAIAAGDVESATEAVRVAQKSLGVAARKGVMHKNAAARRQSRLAKQVNRASA